MRRIVLGPVTASRHAASRSVPSPTTAAMPDPASTDSILSRLLARSDPPPLEPGKAVFAPELTEQIASLKEHDYVKACTSPPRDGR